MPLFETKSESDIMSGVRAAAESPMSTGKSSESPITKEQVVSGQVDLLKAAGMPPWKPVQLRHGWMDPKVTPDDINRVNLLNTQSYQAYHGQALVNLARKHQLSPDEVTDLAVMYNLEDNPRVQNYVASSSFKPYAPQSQSTQDAQPAQDMSGLLPDQAPRTPEAQVPMRPRSAFGTMMGDDGIPEMDDEALPLLQGLMKYRKANPDDQIANGVFKSLTEGDDSQLQSVLGGDADNPAWTEWKTKFSQWSPAPSTPGTSPAPSTPTTPGTSSAVGKMAAGDEISEYMKYLQDRRNAIYSNPLLFQSAAGQAELKDVQTQLDKYTAPLKGAQARETDFDKKMNMLRSNYKPGDMSAEVEQERYYLATTPGTAYTYSPEGIQSAVERGKQIEAGTRGEKATTAGAIEQSKADVNATAPMSSTDKVRLLAQETDRYEMEDVVKGAKEANRFYKAAITARRADSQIADQLAVKALEKMVQEGAVLQGEADSYRNANSFLAKITQGGFWDAVTGKLVRSLTPSERDQIYNLSKSLYGPRMDSYEAYRQNKIDQATQDFGWSLETANRTYRPISRIEEQPVGSIKDKVVPGTGIASPNDSLPVAKTQEEYDKVPPNTYYIDKNGNRALKGKK